MKTGGRFLFKLLSRDPNTSADVHGFPPFANYAKNGAPALEGANEIKGRASPPVELRAIQHLI
jgi:hypothetical protein